MSRRAQNILANIVAANALWTPGTRAAMLRRLGARVGPGVRVYPGIRFIGGVDQLTIGRGSFVNVGVTVGANAPVTIGENVAIGPGVQLLPTTHELGPSTARAGRTRAAPVIVSDGVWIGAGALILTGVTIGQGAVVAAGAVVTGDCDANGVYGGVPARRLNELPTGEPTAGEAGVTVS